MQKGGTGEDKRILARVVVAIRVATVTVGVKTRW